MLCVMLMLQPLCQVEVARQGSLAQPQPPKGCVGEDSSHVLVVAFHAENFYYYAKGDKELATDISVFLEERQIFERFSHIEREVGALKSTILEVRLKNKLTEIANVKTTNNELESDNPLFHLKIDSYRKA